MLVTNFNYTTVRNKTLPEHFSKADIFVTEWRKRTDNTRLIKAVKLLVGMKSKDEILNIGNFLLSMHCRQRWAMKRQLSARH